MYHRVADTPVDPWALSVSPAHFAEQLAVLKRRTVPVPLADVWPCREGESLPRVAITFDDGYADNLMEGVPALEAADVPATVFITTGGIGAGREFWWDELEGILLSPGTLPRNFSIRIGNRNHAWDLGTSVTYSDELRSHHRAWRPAQPPPGPRQTLFIELWRLMYQCSFEEQQSILDALSSWASIPRWVRPSHRTLTLPELRTLADSRGVEIGAHSVTHPFLPNLDRASQQWELELSRNRLESFLGRTVATFAYPHGAHDTATREMVAQAGYVLACSVRPGLVDAEVGALEVPRVMVENWDGVEFERQLDAWLGMSGVPTT